MSDIEYYYLGNTFFFKLKGAAEVYCGFYCEKGGFRISDEDKYYMRKFKAVESTCAFGGGDDPHQPIGTTDTSLQIKEGRLEIPYCGSAPGTNLLWYLC
jgi:Protein of unknown function (DUF616)